MEVETRSISHPMYFLESVLRTEICDVEIGAQQYPATLKLTLGILYLYEGKIIFLYICTGGCLTKEAHIHNNNSCPPKFTSVI